MQAHGPLGVMLVAITALPVIQSVSAAELQPATVYKLFKQCEIEKPQNTDEVASLVECREYIHGMVDILSVNGRVRGKEITVPAVCNVPDDLPMDALIQVFRNWAEKHPERWGEHRINATLAFTDKWPCSN
jgi:hypothetical protein